MITEDDGGWGDRFWMGICVRLRIGLDWIGLDGGCIFVVVVVVAGRYLGGLILR